MPRYVQPWMQTTVIVCPGSLAISSALVLMGMGLGKGCDLQWNLLKAQGTYVVLLSMLEVSRKV